MKDEKRKEAQICYLTLEELNDPSRIVREFTEDVSLEDARKLIVNMRETCSTTENARYGNPKAREDLFYVTDKMLRLFEACYIQQRRIRFVMQWEHAHTRQLKVLEKQVLRNIPGVPNTVPCIMLFGKWLASAEFKPGDDVTIIAERKKILITSSLEWDEKSNDVRLRA